MTSGMKMESNPERSALNLPSSRELGTIFQDELNAAAGLAVRWAADSVQGNRAGLCRWTVPFVSEQGLQGRFVLRWNPDLQHHLSSRLGVSAARPEFMGSVLRSIAGRWASSQALRGHGTLRLLPSPDADEAPAVLERPLRSSAAMLLDSHVLELSFELDQARA